MRIIGEELITKTKDIFRLELTQFQITTNYVLYRLWRLTIKNITFS